MNIKKIIKKQKSKNKFHQETRRWNKALSREDQLRGVSGLNFALSEMLDRKRRVVYGI